MSNECCNRVINMLLFFVVVEPNNQLCVENWIYFQLLNNFKNT